MSLAGCYAMHLLEAAILSYALLLCPSLTTPYMGAPPFFSRAHHDGAKLVFAQA